MQITNGLLNVLTVCEKYLLSAISYVLETLLKLFIVYMAAKYFLKLFIVYIVVRSTF